MLVLLLMMLEPVLQYCFGLDDADGKFRLRNDHYESEKINNPP